MTHHVISDRQFDGGREFAGGVHFASKRKAIEQLLDYHGIDCDREALARIQAKLTTGDVDGAGQEICEWLEWEFIPVECDLTKCLE